MKQPERLAELGMPRINRRMMIKEVSQEQGDNRELNSSDLVQRLLAGFCEYDNESFVVILGERLLLAVRPVASQEGLFFGFQFMIMQVRYVPL
jgi:hypothetical protein